MASNYSHYRSPRKSARQSLEAEFNKTDNNKNKKNAQKLGLRFRTLLKLPKAHKWVYYEWFYANIDQPLFLGSNDFQLCLKENFPNLKTTMLRRVEWCKIRRLMGKPRRCSQAFFNEERAALNSKRNKIRQLQQQKVVDINQFRDLPENIPLALVIGTKVSALLRKPQDGLFTGIIDAVDTVNGTYRITFDRPGIGTHSVPDYEVLSTDAAEFIPLSSFQTKVRPRVPLYPSPKFLEILGNQVANALGSETGTGACSTIGASNSLITSPSPRKIDPNSNLNIHEEGTLGGFPIKFLALLVRLSKILSIKKKMIYELKQMNTEAEKMRTLQENLSHEFQKQYASIALELDRLNSDLNENLKTVQQYSAEIAPEQGLLPVCQPDIMRQKILQDAREIVERSLANSSVKCEKIIDTISHLLALMIHLKGFAETDISSYELQSLNDAVNETQETLMKVNQDKFDDMVKVPINHIESSLSHLGNLGAFAESFIESA